jgi:hypothetical protein
MRVALKWTINDFPAYGMVSGWSTHGKLACPYCMENNKAFTRTNRGKASFFYYHHRFLPPNHRYRKNRKDFFVGRVENDVNELIEPYRVAPSINLEENLNFRVFDDSLVDVDTKELNIVLSSSGQANVDKDDDIHIKDCDGADDYSIDDKEEENSD